MSAKTNKIIFWVATGLICALMTFSATMYFMNTEMIQGAFDGYNYPTYIVIPLAIAKILGVIAIVSRRNHTLKEWAYAGFFFDLVLAAAAHYYADEPYFTPIIGIVILLVSYNFQGRAFAKA